MATVISKNISGVEEEGVAKAMLFIEVPYILGCPD